MMHPSDTPPNGDFVRYVERLTASSAAIAATGQADLRKPESGVNQNSKRGSQPAARATVAQPPVERPSFAGIAFLTHLKWLVLAWIAIQLLASFVSWAGVLFIPVLLAYVAWIIFRVNQNGSGALAERLREVLAYAAEEARKAQQTHHQNHRQKKP